jgi:hypothetical protein
MKSSDLQCTTGASHAATTTTETRRRAILTEQQAIDIFGFRSENSITTMVSSASFVAKRYGINERTFRDIWKQRTWTHATCSLAEEGSPMAKRKMIRPVGSKDTRPRKQKFAATPSISLLKLPSDAFRPRSEYHESATASDQEQHDRAARQRLCSSSASCSWNPPTRRPSIAHRG